MEEALQGDACMIDIEEQNILLTEQIAKETAFMPSFSCSIYKAPCKHRAVNVDMYVPHLISIGPYHRGKQTLGATDNYKVSYLHSFIGRDPKTSLRDYMKAVRGIEAEARECYAEQINLSSDDLVEMMVLDSCFILELFMTYHLQESSAKYKGCLFNALRRDMILLENQIPFFVLDCLYNLSQCSKQTPPLIKLALDFFDPILPTIVINKIYPVQPKHLLDLLRTHLVHQFKPIEFGDNPFQEYTTCATSLQGAGVEFKRKNTGQCLLDITFSNDGKFEIPPFTFGESWNVLFPNLLALEQCRRDYPDMITSYVMILNRLINSHEDVKLLSNTGIINCLFVEDNNKVGETMDKLCQEVFVNKFYYKGLCGRANAYRRTPWNKWRATLMDNHFSTSWADISYGAAVMFLVLVLAQTFLLVLTSG